ncbi:MAG: TolC family protein [Isosphaeraceae bacterium]
MNCGLARPGPARFRLFVAIWLLLAGRALYGQQAQVDVEEPRGSSGSRGKLGPSLGASGTSDFDDTGSIRPIGGRVGASVSRAPVDSLSPPSARGRQEGLSRFRLAVTQPAQIPAYGELSEAPSPELLGPDDGVTLDSAIQRLVESNLALLALRYELPMADADALTASLRSNPIFYADGQLIPYGHYSNHRPGGQRQFDVNITMPIDVTFKRLARMAVADRARAVTAAQFQDAIRQQIDNLYTVYVDALAAQQTLAYSRAFAEGITKIRDRTELLFKAGEALETDVDRVKAQVEVAQLQIREANEAVITASRNLALLMNVPRKEADSIRVHAFLRDIREIPTSDDDLIQMALSGRPDLMAERLAVGRADADIRLAEANRYPDVYVLYQPYTFQDNAPFGFKSSYSWALGVTASVPVFNRNQGNVQRARINAQQTRVELAGMERQVEHEVEQAIREFRLSRTSVVELEREVLPAVRRVRDTAYTRWQGQESAAIDYLEAQKDYNESVKSYRDALPAPQGDAGPEHGDRRPMP